MGSENISVTDNALIRETDEIPSKDPLLFLHLKNNSTNESQLYSFILTMVG